MPDDLDAPVVAGINYKSCHAWVVRKIGGSGPTPDIFCAVARNIFVSAQS
jgi:hypothetical protein